MQMQGARASAGGTPDQPAAVEHWQHADKARRADVGCKRREAQRTHALDLGGDVHHHQDEHVDHVDGRKARHGQAHRRHRCAGREGGRQQIACVLERLSSCTQPQPTP